MKRQHQAYVGILLALTMIALWARTSQQSRQRFEIVPSPCEGVAVIPGGSFLMGHPEGDAISLYRDELPLHDVFLTTFTMACNLVTIAEFTTFMNQNEREPKTYFWGLNIPPNVKCKGGICKPAPGKDNFPIVNVTWKAAVDYCDWLSDAKWAYRLPTEAEWEYAASNGGKTRFPWGIQDQEWVQPTWLGGFEEWGPVGSSPHLRNQWGVHDLIGTIPQWCSDYYSATYYDHSPRLDPPGPSLEEAEFETLEGIRIPYHVNRGGFRISSTSWVTESIVPRAYSRSRWWEFCPKHEAGVCQEGFRWVREPRPTEKK